MSSTPPVGYLDPLEFSSSSEDLFEEFEKMCQESVSPETRQNSEDVDYPETPVICGRSFVVNPIDQINMELEIIETNRQVLDRCKKKELAIKRKLKKRKLAEDLAKEQRRQITLDKICNVEAILFQVGSILSYNLNLAHLQMRILKSNMLKVISAAASISKETTPEWNDKTFFQITEIAKRLANNWDGEKVSSLEDLAKYFK